MLLTGYTGEIREATIIDKPIDKHYIVLTLWGGKQMSIEFNNDEREQARKIVARLNDRS